MEVYHLIENVNVVFITAPEFPNDVPATYEKLKALLPNKPNRRYFGISHPDPNGKIQYKAAAEILPDEEFVSSELQHYCIEKGNFISQYIVNHFKDSNSIGDCFQTLLKHPQIDQNGYCLELYKNYDDLDVHCLVRLKSK
ncbi:MAG TPA: transcriptional regulator [Bacteroidia bacterium]|nr:transcriptional regulator [Bacteroidia bacterium]